MLKLGLIVLEEKMFMVVNIFFYFTITFSSGIQMLVFIWTNLDSFYRTILCVNFGWMLLNGSGEKLWKFYFAHFNTNSFALISESYAFFRESYAFIRESLALIHERFALIREKYFFSLQKCAHCAFKEDRFYKLYWTITLTTMFCIIYC